MADNRIIRFENGEGIFHQDFEDLRDQILLRATHQQYTQRLMSLSGEGFDPNGFVGTINPNGAVISTLTVSYGDNVYYRLTTASPDLGTAEGQFIRLDGESVVLSTNVGNPDRFDAIYLIITESNDNPTSRDFKDAVTGALTSQSVNKSINTSATIGVVQGTPGSGRPTAPGPILGYAFLEAGASTILRYEDATIPLNKGAYTVNSHLSNMVYGLERAIAGSGNFGDWEQGAATASNIITSVDDLPIEAPIPVNYGDRATRLLEIRMKCNINGAAPPTNFAVSLFSGKALALQEDFTSLVNSSGLLIARFAAPYDETTWPSPEEVSPLWCNGETSPNASTNSPSLTLIINPGTFTSTGASPVATFVLEYIRWTVVE